MKKVQAILKHPTLTAAFKEIYPNQKHMNNAHNLMITPEVFNKLKELLSMDSVIKANKDILEKVLFVVIARWMEKGEKTTDMIAAIRELTKLVPEFKDKIQVEDITTASEEELDRKLRGFGYDPNIVAAN
jgi:hypothetical protein